LAAKISMAAGPEAPPGSRVPLSTESRAIMLRVLSAAASSLPPEIGTEVAQLTAIAQGAPPQPAPVNFPKEVEEAANIHFKEVRPFPSLACICSVHA
jgi:hypothetical protein